jgi:uncharacterized protein YbjT (DUF2867 family)
MRVLVTGAYGMIGSACLARLHREGHTVVGCGRSISAAGRRFAYARWREADFSRLHDAQAWAALLTDIDAVVNCVGVLQDGLRDDVQRVQFSGTIALFDGCVLAGVKRIVHISAIGADAAGPSRFSRSKAAAEAHLRALALEWVILRPALVIAPAVYGGTAMLRAVAAFPGIVPVIGTTAKLQIVAVDDLAETVARALPVDTPSKVTWEVGHPEVHTLAEIVAATRAWLGFRPRPIVPLPTAIATIIAKAADALGWLGWRSPVRSTSLAQLTAGVVGDPKPWLAATGIVPQGLAQIFAARPASVQDRWFARLHLLKPLAILILAVAAFTTGAVQATLAGKILGRPGNHLGDAGLYLFRAAAAGLVGFGLVFRASARLALIALIVLTVIRGAADAIDAWQFNVFPFGVLVYEIPIVLAMLLTLAILDDR